MIDFIFAHWIISTCILFLIFSAVIWIKNNRRLIGHAYDSLVVWWEIRKAKKALAKLKGGKVFADSLQWDNNWFDPDKK